MSEAKSPEEAAAWHRRFAAASNNRAWDLSVQTRNAAEDEEMLHAAHASAWHWSKVGTELNRMRATMLLAEVHAHAASAAGETAAHRASYESAAAAIQGVSNEEERRIVASTFSHVPKP